MFVLSVMTVMQKIWYYVEYNYEKMRENVRRNTFTFGKNYVIESLKISLTYISLYYMHLKLYIDLSDGFTRW